MKRLLNISLGFSLLLFLITASVNATQLVVNGTFDDGLTAWDRSGSVLAGTLGGADRPGMNGDAAVLGLFYTGKSTIHQTFTVSTGHTKLTIDFDWYVLSDGTSSSFDSSIMWSLGGPPFSQVEELISGNYENEIAYGHVTHIIDTNQWDVNAEMKLEFNFLPEDAGVFGVSIDNVSVTASPEPATMALLGLGLLGLVGVGRKKM